MALPVVNSSRYTTTIPSTGVQIEYRPYNVREEKHLMIALESKDQKMIIRSLKDVITQCVFESINVEKFTIFDFEKIFLALRSKSVGEMVDLELKCLDKECNSVTSVQVDLEKINLSEIPESNIVNIDKDIGVTLRFPSINDVEKYDETDISNTESAFDLVIDCIETIFDDNGVYDTKDEPRESVQAFVDNLNSNQFKKITNYFENIPTLTHNIEYKCVKCGKENNLELKGLQSFFT
tara:strand:- start:1351 stop:2061 length:711 start_codon:yes stop_codon:yes gene_type:complete